MTDRLPANLHRAGLTIITDTNGESSVAGAAVSANGPVRPATASGHNVAGGGARGGAVWGYAAREPPRPTNVCALYVQIAP